MSLGRIDRDGIGEPVPDAFLRFRPAFRQDCVSWVYQLEGTNPQRLREFVQCAKGEILFGPFDRSNVGAMKIASSREGFLRPSPLLAEPAHNGGDDID
jgi:hypothetical protein